MNEFTETLSNLRVLHDRRRADVEQRRLDLGCSSCGFESPKAMACKYYEPRQRRGSSWGSWCNDVCKHGPDLVRLREEEDRVEERRRRLTDAGVPVEDDRLKRILRNELDDSNALLAVRSVMASPSIRWLTMSGSVGCGKTLAAFWALAERRGLYLTAGGLARLSAFSEEGRLTVDDAMKAGLLVVDDLGMEPQNAHASAQVEEVFTSRDYGSKLTIVTTNKTQAELFQRYGDRFRSRLSGERGVFQSFREGDRRVGSKLLLAARTEGE